MTISNYIPVVSFFKAVNSTKKQDSQDASFLSPPPLRDRMKLLGHLAYAIAFMGSLSVYATRLGITGELNPLKQPEAIAQYRMAKQTLFGENGLADANHDGAVSVIERIEAYQKMGFHEFEVSFPDLTLEDLAKGIDAYKER